MSATLINNFIRQLKEIQEGSLWFDQSLKDKLENVSGGEAFAVPLANVHSVAEHVSHMLEWRKECILRYNGGKTELMELPNDWRGNQELQQLGWEKLKQLLYDSTQDLINLIDGRDDEYLNTPFRDTEYNFKYLMEGIVHHDIYHLGQIGVTLKLLRAR